MLLFKNIEILFRILLIVYHSSFTINWNTFLAHSIWFSFSFRFTYLCCLPNSFQHSYVGCHCFLNILIKLVKLLFTLFYRTGNKAQEGKEFFEFTCFVNEWAMTLSLLFYFSPRHNFFWFLTPVYVFYVIVLIIKTDL